MAKMEDKYESYVEPLLSERPHPYITMFLNAAKRTEFGVQDDYNDRSQVRDGAFVYRHASKNGIRQSSARQMLLPQMKESNNLHVLTNAQVEKLNIEDDGKIKSVQVQYGDEVFHVRARYEVILSAGAYATPQLLLLSGIGPKQHLQEHNIDVVRDLPGVGEHLQDHFQTYMKIRVGSGSSWFPRGISPLQLLPGFVDWIASGKGIFETSGVGFGYFGASEKTFQDTPDLQIHSLMTAGDDDLLRTFLNTRKDVFDSEIGKASDYSDFFTEGFLATCANLHPRALGTVRLGDDDGHRKPKITYNAFENKDDLNAILSCIRRFQVMLKSWNDNAMNNEEIPAVKLLAHRSLERELGQDTDEYWIEYIRQFSGVIYHPTGTCRMGQDDDDMAVVNSKLQVFGLKNLRVADASIMPEITSGNTNVPSAAIGLKAAELLINEYGSL
jgi:choline dehydrogenase